MINQSKWLLQLEHLLIVYMQDSLGDWTIYQLSKWKCKVWVFSHYGWICHVLDIWILYYQMWSVAQHYFALLNVIYGCLNVTYDLNATCGCLNVIHDLNATCRCSGVDNHNIVFVLTFIFGDVQWCLWGATNAHVVACGCACDIIHTTYYLVQCFLLMVISPPLCGIGLALLPLCRLWMWLVQQCLLHGL
jgi:hypothetical protein